MTETIVVVKALVRDENGDILVLRRSETHPHVPLYPDLPGGEVDKGEEFTEALIREIYEETGLSVNPIQCRLLFTSTQWENKKNRVRLLYVVAVPGAKPDVTISWEHDQFQWLDIQTTVDALTHPEYSTGLQYAIEHTLL